MDDEKPTLFRDRYRIPSTRRGGRNYAAPGYYFVTICTKNKVPWFGDVVNGRMRLSDMGMVVDDEWKRTSLIRPYVTLDDYVIMPDHMHAIIIINQRNDVIVETPWHGVSTKRMEWQSGCLGAIINQFKRACTKRIRTTINSDFEWQPRFHDHIIRNERATNRIRKYIADNPTMWHVHD